MKNRTKDKPVLKLLFFDDQSTHVRVYMIDLIALMKRFYFLWKNQNSSGFDGANLIEMQQNIADGTRKFNDAFAKSLNFCF